ncbi:MAG: hypothetical protein ABSG89_12555 [Bacteroidales bacterium]|jgi:type IV secretory pathway VirB3-like protein
MDKTIIKEYEWGKNARIRILVTGIICSALAILFFITKHTILVRICVLILAIAAIILFVQYFIILKNKIYIQVANDGIKISPNIQDFVFSAKVVEWNEISGIKKDSSQITLILTKGGDIKISLAFLNKDDRDNLAQILKEQIEHRPTA